MKTTFYIVLNMKTTDGYESYGRFFIGNDRDFAHRLFAMLQGSEQVNEKDVLHLDLMETTNDLPLNVRVLNCTLDELTLNCRIITKEMFKLLNLEEV